MTRGMWVWMSVCLGVGCGPRLEHPEVATRILAETDQDGDDAISPEEYATLALPRQGFAPLDTNHDRRLDAAELEKAFLTSSPTDFQDEGRRAVHRKYGHPFGGPVDEGVPRGKGKGKGKGKD
ncbi:MAG TPA: hypothetical protein DFR83_01845, partial [Deltaproteobacteria bacterium]|nr:hypothetical protein [Deltaproteobacteria bacterium]